MIDSEDDTYNDDPDHIATCPACSYELGRRHGAVGGSISLAFEILERADVDPVAALEWLRGTVVPVDEEDRALALLEMPGSPTRH